MIKRFVFILILVLILFAFPINAFATERYEIIKIGDEDSFVTQLQNKLSELGYFSGTATGYFGTVTQQAVIDYQSQHDLVVDGKAGSKTLASIMGEDYVISSDRFVADDNVNADTYYPGDKGGEISKIQQRLQDLEYYDYSRITGYYGPITTTAVKRFQRTNDLTEDGITGPITLTLLYSDNAKYFCIYPGDRGADVESLQIALSSLGYYTYHSTTGYFGTITEAALKNFQSQNGLAVDGKAGKNTRAALYSDNAVPYDEQKQVGENDDTVAPPEISAINKMISFANEQLNKPYVYSTEGPSTFDCSGFVYYVLKYVGVSTSRYSAAGFSKISSWEEIRSQDDLIKGDLLFFKSDTSSYISHTGIYLGNDTIIHASSGGGRVKISEMTSYYDRNFVLARRVF